MDKLREHYQQQKMEETDRRQRYHSPQLSWRDKEDGAGGRGGDVGDGGDGPAGSSDQLSSNTSDSPFPTPEHTPSPSPVAPPKTAPKPQKRSSQTPPRQVNGGVAESQTGHVTTTPQQQQGYNPYPAPSQPAPVPAPRTEAPPTQPRPPQVRTVHVSSCSVNPESWFVVHVHMYIKIRNIFVCIFTQLLCPFRTYFSCNICVHFTHSSSSSRFPPSRLPANSSRSSSRQFQSSSRGPRSRYRRRHRNKAPPPPTSSGAALPVRTRRPCLLSPGTMAPSAGTMPHEGWRRWDALTGEQVSLPPSLCLSLSVCTHYVKLMWI